jgi:large subunit ribosomal protein L21
MYAIVDIAGQQFKVEKDKKLFVHRQEGDAGSEISFDKVLLIENDGKLTIGNPVIKNAAVSAKVIEHVKGDKVLVFKKKRRKGYKKLNGHRQYLTRIEITGINERAEKKAAETATEKKPAADKAVSGSKTTSKKPATAKKPATETKTATETKAAKKPAAAKTATKSGAKKPAATKSTAAAKKPAATKSTAAAKKPAAKKSDSGEKAADTK